MAERFVSRGFVGRRRAGIAANRVPPGQQVRPDFPVLSAGPTPKVDLNKWTFTIEGLVKKSISWSWPDFLKLPQQDFIVDIHCVTKWTNLDTRWHGVSVDTLLEQVEIAHTAQFVIAYTIDGYTTNMPLPDIINGQAFVAWNYNDRPLAPEHGGPVRLVVPHLYFWKSAKWVTGLRLTEKDKSGFWESAGYNNHGDPWKEERYTGD